MNRFVIVLAAAVLCSAAGCHPQHINRHGGGCPHCQGHGANGGRIGDGLLAGHYARHRQPQEEAAMEGPPTAAVAYPYYTVRGPRDFLVNNPPSIGR